MKRKLPNPNKLPSKALRKRIGEELREWNELYTHGSADAICEDGYLLNRKRARIIYLVGILKERDVKERQLVLEGPFDFAIPPEQDAHFMANAEGIRANAKNTLEAILTSPDFPYLVRTYSMLTPGERHTISIAPLQIVDALKQFVDSDNLMELKKYQDAEYWLTLLANMKKRRDALDAA